MIDLTPYQLDIVLAILKKHVPQCEVRAFGSRYKWTAKDYSDLDLAIVAEAKLDKKIIYVLKEDFSESDLPIRVDVLDWWTISDEFKQIIEQGYEVIQTAENKLPVGWEIRKLGDVVKIVDGDRGSNYPNGSDFVSHDGYCVFLNAKNVPNSMFDFSVRVYITKEKDLLLRKGKLQRGDFVITTRGTVGNYAYYSENISYDNIRINSGMIIVKINDLLFYKYFKYYLAYEFKTQLNSFVSGSAQPQLPIKDLVRLSITIPPLAEQKSIASVLSGLDDKIELNQQINKKLEEMAQAMFKQWFIDFNFPDENGNPYKNFGGEMVDSELGQIPYGWSVGKLGDFGRIICGRTPPKNKMEFFGGEIPFIKIPDMHDRIFILNTVDTLTKSGSNFQITKIIPENSICVSCIATVGLVSITTQQSHTNQQINSIILDKKGCLYYLYLLLKNNKNNLRMLASGGTTTPNMNTSIFKHISVITPNITLLEMFYQIVSSAFEQIKINMIEINTLSVLRNSLLPKLMSGEILLQDVMAT